LPAKKLEGKLQMTGSDTLKYNRKAKDVIKDYSWVEKWIDVSRYLNAFLK